jgi:hypothetical protein
MRIPDTEAFTYIYYDFYLTNHKKIKTSLINTKFAEVTEIQRNTFVKTIILIKQL